MENVSFVIQPQSDSNRNACVRKDRIASETICFPLHNWHREDRELIVDFYFLSPEVVFGIPQPPKRDFDLGHLINLL